VTGTQGNVTVTFIGGCTIGFKPEQLTEIIKNILEGRPIPPELLDRYEHLIRDFGVTDTALANFFRILGEKKVAQEDLDAKLREIAAKHLALLKNTEPLPSDEPGTQARKKEAGAAIAAGDYARAEKLLTQTVDAQLAAAKEAQDKADQYRLAAAETKADVGELKTVQLQYDAAADAFREAAALVPATKPMARAEYLNQAGVTAIAAGSYAVAITVLREALMLRDNALGPDAIELVGILNNLADALHDQGQYAEAEALHKRALKIKEKAGVEDESLSTSLHNLAAIYQDQGRYSEAEPLYKKALAIRERVLGHENVRVAHTLMGLGQLYLLQKPRQAEAEPLFKRAIAIFEKVLGPQHPDLATAFTDLASLYSREGRLPEAEQLYARALEIYQGAPAPNQHLISVAMNNLALLYLNQERYDKAEPLFARALAIQEKAIGPEHPALAETLNNLALLYNKQGEYTKAEPLYKRAINIDEKVFDPTHPNFVRHLNNLAVMYIDQHRLAEAEPLCKRILAIKEKQFGAEHPAVAHDLDRLAAVYYLQGQFAEAQPLLRRALVIDEKALGHDNPETLEIRAHLELLRSPSRH
jgi:tetratricopeptide (TPR) repeat protein